MDDNNPKVWALWNGGPSYAPPQLPRDLEVFERAELVQEALMDRYLNKDGRTPVVGTDSYFDCWLDDPTSAGDVDRDRDGSLVPDFRLTFNDLTVAELEARGISAE